MGEYSRLCLATIPNMDIIAVWFVKLRTYRFVVWKSYVIKEIESE
jgi:hypothetical protein